MRFPHRAARPIFSLTSRLKRGTCALRDFLRDRMLRRLPSLTPAEKTALAALLLVLGAGAGLRAWERSGVRLGPVDDWDSLRALLIGARAEHDAAGGGAYACLEDPAENRYGGGGNAGGRAGRPLLAAGAGTGRAGAKPPGGPAPAGSKKSAPRRPVDLNAAGEKALLTLPGVGPSTARAILARRAERGRFLAVEELLEVKGIGPKKFEAMKPFIRVSGPPGVDSGKAAEAADSPVKTAPEPAAAGGDL